MLCQFCTISKRKRKFDLQKWNFKLYFLIYWDMVLVAWWSLESSHWGHLDHHRGSTNLSNCLPEFWNESYFFPQPRLAWEGALHQVLKKNFISPRNVKNKLLDIMFLAIELPTLIIFLFWQLKLRFQIIINLHILWFLQESMLNLGVRLILPTFCPFIFVGISSLNSCYYYLHPSFYKSGALQDVLHLHDVLARVALAKLCHTVSRARVLDGNCFV